jgi:hypothetical protein
MATQYANQKEAEQAAHTLSHQPWMPRCRWHVVTREDGTAYVRAYMDLAIPEGEDRDQLDALKHYLGGRFRAATPGHPRSWHGRYGKTEVCVSMPERKPSDPSRRQRSPRLDPPPMAPCRESELLAENARLRQVIAHLMTNPLGQREAVYYTSDIDGQTGHVDITDVPDSSGDGRTIIRITDQPG